MIEIAAKATRGVKIPTGKQSRKAIINEFKKQMQALRDHLNVCIPLPNTKSILSLPVVEQACHQRDQPNM
jgi:hypothetical protein